MALTSLDFSKAMGGGEIVHHILKHFATALLYPVHHLFILYLAQSYLPLEWRSHYNTPILSLVTCNLSPVTGLFLFVADLKFLKDWSLTKCLSF